MTSLDNLFKLSEELSDAKERAKQAEEKQLERRTDALGVAITDINDFGSNIKKLNLNHSVCIKTGVYTSPKYSARINEIYMEFDTNGCVSLSKEPLDPFPRKIDTHLSKYDLETYGKIFDDWKKIFENAKNEFCKIVKKRLEDSIKDAERRVAIADSPSDIYRETRIYKGANMSELKVEIFDNGKWVLWG